jgi:RimJ/RimL family protein N-acetyltransferase
MPDQKRFHYWLRPMKADDIPVLAGWFENLDDLAIFDRRSPLPLNEEATQAGWREALGETEPRACYWFTIDDEEGESVGVAGLQDINHVHGDGVLPIYLSGPARQRGLGIRTTAMLLDLAFHQLRLARVTSFFRADNEASRRMTESAGFREEGRMRQAWFADGKRLDVMVIGILEKEWLVQRGDLASNLSTETVLILGRTPWGTRAWPPLPAADIRAVASV